MSTICDDLRAAILQAAMQGKLTKQLPEDGNARDLLERINCVKKQLNKRAKELDEITDDEIPFSIPENWQWARLGQIFNITAGGTPSRTIPEYWGGDLPWVKIGDMNGKYINATSEYITEMGLKNSSAKLFPSGTLLYSVFASIGTVSILNIDATTNQAIAGLSKYTNDLDTDYMYYALVSLKDILLSQARGAAQLNINQKILSDAIVPIPPLDEQKRIANKIEELMARVADLEQSADTLALLKKAFPDDIKASLLQAAMQGKLTKQLPEDGSAEDLLEEIKAEKEKLIAEGKIKKQKPLAPITDDEITFSIPENWKWAKLGDLTALISDGTHKTPKYVDNGVPFLSVQNISKGYYDFTKIKYITEKEHAELTKRIKPTIDDILICRIGTLGKALKNTLDYEFSIFVSLGVVRLIDVRLVDYVIEVINSPVGFKWIQENKVGGGTHTYKINLSDLPNMLIPLPPLSEQKRISERLDALMQNINTVGDLIASE